MKFLPEQVNVDGGVLIQNQELAFFTTLQEIQQAKLFESKIVVTHIYFRLMFKWLVKSMDENMIWRIKLI